MLPLKTTVLKSMEPNDGDSPAMKESKDSVRVNLQNRYSDPELQHFLNKCTALDPRLRTLPHMDNA